MCVVAQMLFLCSMRACLLECFHYVWTSSWLDAGTPLVWGEIEGGGSYV